jgi:nitrile hydratase subunit beta
MDGAHDLGGMQGFGAVRTPDGELEFHESWELRAQVIGLLSGTARRPAIEALDPGEYLTSSYYVRWLRAAEEESVRSGRLEPTDLDRWRQMFSQDPDAPLPVASDPEMVDFIRHRLGPHEHGDVESAAFAVGDRVRVRRMRPHGHHRSPRYVRGVVGEVERVCGTDPVPGVRDEAEPVYTVRFRSDDLFGPRVEEPPYVLLIDLWERYLEVP